MLGYVHSLRQRSEGWGSARSRVSSKSMGSALSDDQKDRNSDLIAPDTERILAV